MDTRKHGTGPAVKLSPAIRRGRPSARRKPLKERLFLAGVTYAQVATVAKKHRRTVSEHINGRFFSPNVQAAIDKLTGWTT